MASVDPGPGFLAGDTAVPSTVAPTGVGAPVVRASDLLGSHRTVDSIAARDAIPTTYRDEGMTVWVTVTSEIWRLEGGITNSDWLLVGGGVRIWSATSIVATTTAEFGERVIYDPSGGTFTINAPASPVRGSRFAIKNRTSDSTAITVSGNGSNIENPLLSFALTASFLLGSDGASVEWEYDGTQWLVV